MACAATFINVFSWWTCMYNSVKSGREYFNKNNKKITIYKCMTHQVEMIILFPKHRWKCHTNSTHQLVGNLPVPFSQQQIPTQNDPLKLKGKSTSFFCHQYGHFLWMFCKNHTTYAIKETYCYLKFHFSNMCSWEELVDEILIIRESLTGLTSKYLKYKTWNIFFLKSLYSEHMI